MSFFNAPAWAQTQPMDAEELGKDMFSHSGSFLSIAQDRIEREKRRAEKAARKERKSKEEARLGRPSSTNRESTQDEQGSLKKRRISAEDGAKLLASIGVGRDIVVEDKANEANASAETKLPVRRSPRNKRTRDMLSPLKTKSKLGTSPDVNVDDEDDFEIIETRSRPVVPPPMPEEEEDSDPEIAAIERRARARAQAKAQQQKTLPNAVSSDGDLSIGGSNHPTPPPLDPPVQILISSPMANTNPLIIYRKLSQNLQPVKDVWCKKQNFDDAFARTVFLVHRGHRLYDSTTVRRLGLEVDASGQVRSKENLAAEGADKVHVLAMTQKEFQEMKAAKAHESKVRSGEVEESTTANIAEPEPEPEPEPGAEPAQNKEIRVTVKAKGKTTFKVKVMPGTKFGKIIKAAKRSFQIGEEQSVYIEFDGERMESEATVASTEIEDMDCLDMFLES